jgi:hypothetical protein
MIKTVTEVSRLATFVDYERLHFKNTSVIIILSYLFQDFFLKDTFLSMLLLYNRMHMQK